MNVLINGLGNIGTTITNLLAHFKEELRINSISALKNYPQPWEEQQYKRLESRGIKILSREDVDRKKDIFDVVYDCTQNGGGLSNKAWYESFSNLKLAVAQGSETGFGTPYMTSINDDCITDKKFVQVVSCNTHAILSILKYFDSELSNIVDADFVVVRRSEDIGNHERLVASNVIARHRSADGTHHAEDANSVLKTISKKIQITSSDVTTPAQLMHTVRFNITFKSGFEPTEKSPFVANTKFFDSNKIFEIGRREGFQGRLYNHAILADNNFLRTNTNVKGWGFIPQEGNTIISSLKPLLNLSQNHSFGIQQVLDLLLIGDI